MAEKNERAIKVVAENRKPGSTMRSRTRGSGIALTGTEVKSIRNGKTTTRNPMRIPRRQIC